MQKKGSLVAFMLLFGIMSKAQLPGDMLNNWALRSPIEKIYLHFDRDNYLAGENIWFKAYLYSDFLPDTISTTLYAELLTESSVIVSRKTIPVFFATATGHFELPDSLKTGTYIIRAYSLTMLNQDEGFVYKKKIAITGKKVTTSAAPKVQQKKLRLEFFPEGGNFVAGLINTVAFKATHENGLPAEVSGIIKNEKNEDVAGFSTLHNGMGMFDINSKGGEMYYAVIKDDADQQKYYLPELSAKGIALKIMPDPQGKFYEILQQTGDPDFEAAYMTGHMQHRQVFKKDFSKSTDWITGIINTQNLNSGVLQVTVFNKNNMPLAERLCFIDNKEYLQPAELVFDTLNLSVRGKNVATLRLKDTIIAGLSVSVTDPDYQAEPLRKENILSGLLLTSDLKGYVHNPAWYFAAPPDSAAPAIDFVMMTNGWRRFKWAELVKNGVPAKNNTDQGYINIGGRVTIRDSKKPFAGKEMLLIISPSDSSGNSMQFIETDADGNFKLDSVIFYGKASLLFSDIRGKKSSFVDVTLSDDSLAKTILLRPVDVINDAAISALDTATGLKLSNDYDAIIKANGLLLEGVTVRARKKTPLQELEERYASGLFSGGSQKTIDLVNTNEVVTDQNIFLYLQSKVPGLQIIVNGVDYEVYYRQARSLMGGPIPMTLFLDEMQVDAEFISPIPANQIAMVKVFSNFVGAAGNGPGGVLAVYTKKGADFNSTVPTSAGRTSYNGYTVTKEFYSPDYSVAKANSQEDHRITLLWNPDIFLNSVNPAVPISFYNNDRTKSFKIVVEGMTWDGKMIFIEKTVAADKKAF